MNDGFTKSKDRYIRENDKFPNRSDRLCPNVQRIKIQKTLLSI